MHTCDRMTLHPNLALQHRQQSTDSHGSNTNESKESVNANMQKNKLLFYYFITIRKSYILEIHTCHHMYINVYYDLGTYYWLVFSIYFILNYLSFVHINIRDICTNNE